MSAQSARAGCGNDTREESFVPGGFYINLTKSKAKVLAYGTQACDGHKLRALAELCRHNADEARQHSRCGCGCGTVRRGA